MDFSNYKPVSEDISEKYLGKFFEKYSINIELEAAKLLYKSIQAVCSTLETDMPEGLKQTNINVVGKSGYGAHCYDSLMYTIKEIKNFEDAVFYFAEKILQNENRTVSNFEIFDIQERLSKVERKLNRLTGENAKFN